MNRFQYVRARSVAEAVIALRTPGAQVLAGGTNLVDLMKYDVAKPACLVDIGRLPLRDIESTGDGGLRIGALVPNADAAYDARVRDGAPLLASAILAGASAQLRNAATTGGNLLQRTRCTYFYNPDMPCNKREPGTGCPAIGGVNRMHAVLGVSASCIAVHPSDMCVALAALDARVNAVGPQGERSIPMESFHRLPGDRPDVDTTLRPDEIVTSVDLPRWTFGNGYTYLKLRDRLSYAFALVSVAAAVSVEAGSVSAVRIALGGVAHKPWRRPDVEAAMVGQPATTATFALAASAMMEGAVALAGNAFKIELARRAIVRALGQAAAGKPQSHSDKRVG